jgi:hypothetical protein
VRKIPDMLNTEDCKLKFRLHFTEFDQKAHPFQERWCNVLPVDHKEKCDAYADHFRVLDSATATNHEAAVKRGLDYLESLKFEKSLKHLIVVTDGCATDGECNPFRLSHTIKERLKAIKSGGTTTDMAQIVIHTLVVGTDLSVSVPKGLCESTGGIVAAAFKVDQLPEEMNKIFAPIREAPKAFVLRNGRNDVERHGLLTTNHRQVLTKIKIPGNRCMSPHLMHQIEVVSMTTGWFTAPDGFEVVPPDDYEEHKKTFKMPEALKFEMEAAEHDKRLAAEYEEKLRTAGAAAAAEVYRGFTQSSVSAAMPQHLQDRFNRRALATETFASVQEDVPDDGSGPSYRSLAPDIQRQHGAGMPAGFERLASVSMQSQSDY